VQPLDSSIIPVDKHHPVLTTEYAIPVNFNHFCSDITYLDYRKANYYELNITFASFNWSNVYKVNDINTALNIFYKIVLNTIEKTVPRKILGKNKFPSWFTKEIHTNKEKETSS